MSSLPLISFQVTNGIIWGLIVALLAVGLNLIYGLLNIVNVAQGAFYMVGAYLTWLAWSTTGSFALGVVLGPLIVGVAAIVLERAIIRPIEHDHNLTIIMTIGLSLVLEQGALALFGGEIRSVGSSSDLYGANLRPWLPWISNRACCHRLDRAVGALAISQPNAIRTLDPRR